MTNPKPLRVDDVEAASEPPEALDTSPVEHHDEHPQTDPPEDAKETGRDDDTKGNAEARKWRLKLRDAEQTIRGLQSELEGTRWSIVAEELHGMSLELFKAGGVELGSLFKPDGSPDLERISDERARVATKFGVTFSTNHVPSRRGYNYAPLEGIHSEKALRGIDPGRKRQGLSAALRPNTEA